MDTVRNKVSAKPNASGPVSFMALPPKFEHQSCI
jgi:hypothetical protein